MSDTGSKNKAYHIRVEADPYFLNLLLNQSTTLAELDDFLRAIWLECCGHMSAFRIKGKEYLTNWDDMNAEIGEPQKQTVEEVFSKTKELEYEYDFGSTTYLLIKNLAHYDINMKENLLLLSRNEPLPVLCHLCEKKPAQSICTIEYDGPRIFCKDCSKVHAKTCADFEDYAAMEIVNSPRTGVCGYDGGTIDKERDGIWKDNS